MGRNVSFEIAPLAIKPDWGFSRLEYSFKEDTDDVPTLILHLSFTERYAEYLASQIMVLSVYMMAEKKETSSEEILKISGFQKVCNVLSWLKEDNDYLLKGKTTIDQEIEYLRSFTMASFEITRFAIKPDWGFSRLEYSIEEPSNRPELILHLPIAQRDKYLYQPEVDSIYPLAKVSETSSEVILKTSGLRKIYHILAWLKKDSNYNLRRKITPIDQQLKYLKSLIEQKPLPKYQFWSQDLTPTKYRGHVDKSSTKIEVMCNKDGQTIFSKESMGLKNSEHTQVTSIYQYYLLGDETCLDWVKFKGHLRESINSLGIPGFQSMFFLRQQGRLPSFEEFVRKGEARHNVACFVNEEPDRNLSNCGIKEGGEIARVDNERAPWPLVSRYYGVPANKEYYFDVDGLSLKARPPANAFEYSGYDVQYMPFVRDVELIHATVNSFISRYSPRNDLSLHLKGIQYHPDYILEKFHYFLQSILYPDSFHQQINEGMLSPTRHMQYFIKYRRNNYLRVRNATFSCDDFWLYLHAYPEWIEQITAKFSCYNLTINKYYGCNNLMNVKEVMDLYNTFIALCADKLKKIIPSIIEEIEFFIKIYQNFSDNTNIYKMFIKRLKIVVLDDFRNFLKGKSTTLPIRFLDKAKYEITKKELKELDYCLLADARLFFNERRSNINLNSDCNNGADGFDLLYCVFLNHLDRVDAEIKKMGGLEDAKLIRETPSGLTGVELALACGHQQMARKLFLQEKKLEEYTPSRKDTLLEITQCAPKIRAKAKEYFLKLCEPLHHSTENDNSSLLLLDLKQEMRHVFLLLRMLKKDFYNKEDFKSKIYTWASQVTQEAAHHDLCHSVLNIVEETIPVNHVICAKK